MKFGDSDRAHRFLAAAIAAALPFASVTARAQDIPTDPSGFTTYVAKLTHAAIRDISVDVKGPLTLAVGQMQANLDRVYAFCKADMSGCAREIDTYVKGVVEAAHSQGAAPKKEAIRLVVRTSDYARQTYGAHSLALVRPFVEGLALVPVFDFSRTIRGVNEKDMTTLGLNSKQVFEAGLANLRSNLKPPTESAPAAPSGQIRHFTGDIYQPSRLALVESWAPIAHTQHDVLIVAAPTTDTVLYVGEDSPVAIDALRTLANNLRSHAPNPLSDILLRWTPKGWSVVR